MAQQAKRIALPALIAPWQLPNRTGATQRLEAYGTLSHYSKLWAKIRLSSSRMVPWP